MRKLVGPILVASDGNGDPQSFKLPPIKGGSLAKTFQLWIKITSTSNSPELRVELQHGPQVGWYDSLANPLFTYTAVSEGSVLEGAVGAAGLNSEVLGEVLQVDLLCQDSSTQTATAMIEVYYILRPF